MGAQRLAVCAGRWIESGSAARRLLVTVDGRFTNSTVLRHIPQRTVLIGRVRKDRFFFILRRTSPSADANASMACAVPTPEALLKDPAVPWQKLPAYSAGQTYEFKIKTLGPVYSAMDKGQNPLRLLVIEPVPYRNSKKSKLERREPAYLICTDPDLPLQELLQVYLWRWDIEVNFRDEKTILGVGQAQVRSESSNQNAPPWPWPPTPCCCWPPSKLMAPKASPRPFRVQAWYRRKPTQRATTNELINQLRYELWAQSLSTEFYRLHQKPPQARTA